MSAPAFDCAGLAKKLADRAALILGAAFTAGTYSDTWDEIGMPKPARSRSKRKMYRECRSGVSQQEIERGDDWLTREVFDPIIDAVLDECMRLGWPHQMRLPPVGNSDAAGASVDACWHGSVWVRAIAAEEDEGRVALTLQVAGDWDAEGDPT